MPGVSQRWARTLAPFAAPVFLGALLGAPAGLVWFAVAPRPELTRTPHGTAYANPEPHALIAADGWFAGVTAVAGLLCGVGAYVAARDRLDGRLRDVAVLVVLTISGLAGSLVTWRVGQAVGHTGFHDRLRSAQPGTHVLGALQLHAMGVLVAWPLVAVVAFAVLLALQGRDTGRRS